MRGAGAGRDGRAELRRLRRPDAAGDGLPWTRHASGVLAPASGEPAPLGLTAWPPSGVSELAGDGMYDTLAEHGLAYGPAFRGVSAMWRRDDEVFASVSLPSGAGSARSVSACIPPYWTRRCT